MVEEPWSYVNGNSCVHQPHSGPSQSESSDSYERKLKEFESSWSQSFHQYYMVMIHSEVSKVNAMQYLLCMCCTI